jgi:predicted DNA repair protein MutK
MALGGLLALLDDIASMSDDVAKMAALATKKSAGIVVDDLAVTAGGMAGMAQDRETNFVVRVAKASLRNKLLWLVPGALLIQALLPQAMGVLLFLGGAFLAYEAVHKGGSVVSGWFRKPSHPTDAVGHVVTSAEDVLAQEEQRVEDAIRTDFVLSAEIVALSLATMERLEGIALQAVALVFVAVLMTVAVYGAVLLLVKIDDLGLWLVRIGRGRAGAGGRSQVRLGLGLLRAAPWIFRFIGAVGTIAMLLVGGELLAHGLHLELPVVQRVGVAIVGGAVVSALVAMVRRLRSKLSPSSAPSPH